MEATCRVCQSPHLVPLEPYPRVLIANGKKATWQNHRCDDCGATTVVRTFEEVDVAHEDTGEVPPRVSKKPPRKATRRS